MKWIWIISSNKFSFLDVSTDIIVLNFLSISLFHLTSINLSSNVSFLNPSLNLPRALLFLYIYDKEVLTSMVADPSLLE